MKRLRWWSGALLSWLLACGGDTVIDAAQQSGSGASTAASGGNGSGASGASTSSNGASGGSGGRSSCGECDENFFSCCPDGTCANTGNDPLHCGGCDGVCVGDHPFCDNGTCTDAPCDDDGPTCSGNSFCCGSSCCEADQLCCVVQAGPVGPPQCYDPVDGTCPKGNPGAVCAAPETPIATPDGERPIAELRVGDRVYSIDRGELAVVPIAAVNRHPVQRHSMVVLELDGGRRLRLSGAHPSADGRTIAELGRGDRLGSVAIANAVPTPYEHGFTHDILPASDTGSYFAAGALVGSTLFGWEATAGACVAAPR